MQNRNLRVMLASEHPESLYFLKEMIEKEDSGVVVGQAQNVTRVVALARKLRPDVAIIDSYLPYAEGLDKLPLSRSGGLDAAQIISQEIPNTKVVLLGNLERELTEHRLGADIATFSKETRGSIVTFTLGNLHRETASPSNITFANLEVKPWATLPDDTGISDKLIFFGSISLLVGMSAIATFFLVYVGIVLALAGGTALFLGVVAKLLSTPRLKIHAKTGQDEIGVKQGGSRLGGIDGNDGNKTNRKGL